MFYALQYHYEWNMISLTLIKSLQICSSITRTDCDWKLWTEFFREAWGNYFPWSHWLLFSANIMVITSSLTYALCNLNAEVLHTSPIQIVFSWQKFVHTKHFHPDKKLWECGFLPKFKINLYTTDFMKKSSPFYFLMYFGKGEMTEL